MIDEAAANVALAGLSADRKTGTLTFPAKPLTIEVRKSSGLLVGCFDGLATIADMWSAVLG